MKDISIEEIQAKTTSVNERVDKAGFYYIGHFSRGKISIIFKAFALEIPFQKQYMLSTLLSTVFDIDSENGMFLEDIKGKYCRVLYNESGLVALQHILEDDRFILIKDLI